jgi:hypothetical protein
MALRMDTEVFYRDHYKWKRTFLAVIRDPAFMRRFTNPTLLVFCMLEAPFSKHALFPPGRTVSRLTLDFLTHAPLGVFIPHWQAAEILRAKAARCSEAPAFFESESAIEALLRLRHTTDSTEVHLIAGKGIDLSTLPLPSPKFTLLENGSGERLIIDYAHHAVVLNGERIVEFSPSYDNALRTFLETVLSGTKDYPPMDMEEALGLHQVLFGLTGIIDDGPPLPPYPLGATWESVMQSAQDYSPPSPCVIYRSSGL